jgi:hypothetical protein
MSDRAFDVAVVALAVTLVISVLAITAGMFYPTWCQYLPEPGRCVVATTHTEYRVQP